MKLYQLFILSHAFFHMFVYSSMNVIIDFGKEYRFKSKRILFPEPERQQLIKFCNEQLYQKRVTKFNSESSQLLHQMEEKQKTNLALKIRHTELLEEIVTLEKRVQTLQKKQPVLDKKTTTVPVGKVGKKLSGQEKLKAMRILMKQYEVREKSVLLLKLRDKADIAFHNNNPNFDKESHFFKQKINQLYRCIFCPCTNQLEIVDNSLEVPLPKGFACSDTCQFYPDKDASSASDIDTSTESESDSDTQEKIPEITPYTKKQIETLADM